MKNRLIGSLIIIWIFLVSSYAYAQLQTCVNGGTSPPTPPNPTSLVVNLPPNGATIGCTISAIVAGGAAPKVYPIGNAKCATAVAMAAQAAAIDNGWNDGGTP